MTDYPEALAAALDAQKPSGFAYRYRDALAGGTVIRFNSGHAVNGSRPIDAVPYWLGAPPAPVALAVPAGYVPVSALIEAREEVESWAAYATPYFQDKHDLAEVLAKIDGQIAAAQAQQPAAAVPDDAIEAAYWDFDARHKGYGPHKITPQSERDAFKWAVRALLADADRNKEGG